MLCENMELREVTGTGGMRLGVELSSAVLGRKAGDLHRIADAEMCMLGLVHVGCVSHMSGNDWAMTG